VKLRELLTKINDAVRPVHVGDAEPSYDPLDARVTARAGNAGATTIGGGPAPATTDWVPSQQDEEPHH